MAETKDGKERVWVRPHKQDGKTIPGHYRTPPCPPAKAPPKKGR